MTYFPLGNCQQFIRILENFKAGKPYVDHLCIMLLEIAEDPGRKIIFDNVDLYVQRHEMTEENQNKDLHWVTVISTENRISQVGYNSAEKPANRTLADMDNAVCLPDKSDHRKQRTDYTALVLRLITSHIDCLKFLQDVTEKHITHQHRRETSKPTETVSHPNFKG